MTSTTLEQTSARYREATEAAQAAAEYDCSLISLRGVLDRGDTPSGGWLERFEQGFPRNPSEEQLEASHIARLQLQAEARQAAADLYRALLEEGEAYEIREHEANASRPFEIIAAASRRWVSSSFITAHGSSLSRARYGSRAAAEKALAKLNAAELERISAEASR